jgi:hypothetical protein
MDRSILRQLPNDLIKIIISYSRCPQWFTLCKQLHTLARHVINPLDYKKTYQWDLKEQNCGPLLWAIYKNNKYAVASLLQDDRVDPSAESNSEIQFASYKGYTEIVKLLLQGTIFFLKSWL